MLSPAAIIAGFLQMPQHICLYEFVLLGGGEGKAVHVLVVLVNTDFIPIKPNKKKQNFLKNRLLQGIKEML